MPKPRDIQTLEVILEKLVYIENIVHRCTSKSLALIPFVLDYPRRKMKYQK